MPVLERLRRFRRAAVWLVIAILAVGLCAFDARAQLVSGQDRAPLLAEQDQLFQRMLREPGNLDVAFAYAAQSSATMRRRPPRSSACCCSTPTCRASIWNSVRCISGCE